jgi:hypothetical protein
VLSRGSTKLAEVKRLLEEGMDRRRRTRPVSSLSSLVESLEHRLVMSATVAALVPDRFEPNDSYDAATDLGTLGDRTETGLSIHAANNYDYYKFKAAASGALSVTFSFDQSQGDIDVFLLDSNRLLMDSSATTNSPERLDVNVTAGQTYFIKVLGYAGATQPSYSMAIDGPGTATAGDADDQTTEARPLALTGSVTDSISSATDVDLYKITVATGQKVTFDVDRTTGSSLDSYLRVFNSSGSQIKSNNDANAPGETATTPKESYISYTFSTAGTYYVGVSGNPNSAYSATTGNGDVAGSTGSYKLTLPASAVAPADSDDQIAEARALSIGSSVSDSVSIPTDVDLFKFTVKAGQKLGFDVDPASGSTLDSYLRVFNASGSRIAGNDNKAAPGETLGKSAYLEYTFTTAGTYYVGVSGAPNSAYSVTTGNGDVAGSTGGYKLFLVNLTPAAASVAGTSLTTLSLRPAGAEVLGDPRAIL